MLRFDSTFVKFILLVSFNPYYLFKNITYTMNDLGFKYVCKFATRDFRNINH